MELKYKNYIARSEGDRFNLTEIRNLQKKDGTPTDRETVIGYSYRFENMVKNIVDLEVAKNEDVTTLQGYIKAWKEIRIEVLGILNIDNK